MLQRWTGGKHSIEWIELPEEEVTEEGDAVFIAHGRSSVWRELKEYLESVLAVKNVEFNSDPTPGRITHERVTEMLGRSRLAFLIFTAEDEQADGSFRTREMSSMKPECGWAGSGRNVLLLSVIGIVPCPPSLDGITRIDFSYGQIRATFADVREVLVRERVLPLERS